jgi:hypothetical protein
MGALPGQPQPIWCYDPPESGPTTFTQGANSWLDDFNHGLSLANLGAGYRVFSSADAGAPDRLNRYQYWRHADHWMVDVNGRDQTPADGQPTNFGGTTMRPDRSFHFENGRLIVEADVAAGVTQYGKNAWPELTVTTAPAPTDRADDLYGYGIFKGHYTFGCRLESDRGVLCALFASAPGPGTTINGRLYETPFSDLGGMVIYDNPRPAAWRTCQNTDPDTNCRDRFRLELTQDSFNFYVNGVRMYGASQIPPDRQFPSHMVNGEVYVYFASWIGKPNADTVRFHWDRISINNGVSGAPEPGPVPAPAPTPTPVPTACSPRPKVTVTTAPAGPGQLQVTVAAKTNSGVPNNRLRAIQVLSTKNAVTDIDGQTGRQGAFTVPLSGGPQQTTFMVRRATPGVAMTVPMKVVDDCGSWDTFVGAGPNAP